MKIELIEKNNNFELVKVNNGTRYPYQINNREELSSDKWFCFGAWDKLEEAKEVFKKKFS